MSSPQTATGGSPTGLLSRFRSLRSYGISGFAQGLNFIAMLLPVLGRQADQLTYLVVPLALANLVCRASTFAYPGRYLAIPDRLTRTASATALSGLIACTAAFLVAAVALTGRSGYWAGVLAWSGALAFTHGLYFIAVAVVSRERRMNVYARARLVYGVVNIIGTTLVVFVTPFREGLVVVAGIITLTGAVMMLTGTSDRVVPAFLNHLPRILNRPHRAYMRASFRASGAQLLTDLAFQMQGLMTPFLGPYKEIWAVTLRLTGGFSGLAQQVIAPGFEMRISEAARSGDHPTVRQWTRRGLAGSGALALFTAVVVIGAVMFATDVGGNPWWVLAAVGVFSGGSLLTSLVIKVPYITGRDTPYLIWSLLRPTLLGLSLFLSGGQLLVAVAVIQVISAVTFVPLALLPPLPTPTGTPPHTSEGSRP